MDSLTQAVLGATVGYAVGGKVMGRKAALWGIGLGTLPDLDVLLKHIDPIESFITHRSFSHSVFFSLVLAPSFGKLMTLIHGIDRSHRIRLSLMAFIVLVTHALLDSLTSYGTQLLWPLNTNPFAVSSISIIDPIYTLPLLIAAIWVLARRSLMPDGTLAPSQPLTARVNSLALVFSTLYLGFGLVTQAWLSQTVETKLAEQGIKAEQLLVTPTLGNSLLWYTIARQGDDTYYSYISLLDKEVGETEWTKIERQTALLDKVAKKAKNGENQWPDLVKRMSQFSKGFYAIKEENGQIIYHDLRMGLAPDFVFRFTVAKAMPSQATDNKQTEGNLVKVSGTLPASEYEWLSPSIQLGRQIDDKATSFLWSRIFDPEADRGKHW